MNVIQKICLFFTILGGINWGLHGLFAVNLVDMIFKDGTIWATIVYTIIAICSIVNILIFFIDLRTNKVREIPHIDK